MSNTNRRQINRAGLLACLPVIVTLLGMSPADLQATNGDLLGLSEALSSANRELIDLTEDSRDGTFWALGAN